MTLCVIVYKCLREMAPAYLAKMCIQVSARAEQCHLRSSAHGDLVVPRCRTTQYDRRNCLASSAVPWNSLLQTVRDTCLSLTQFCSRLKMFLFYRAYRTLTERRHDSFYCKVYFHAYFLTYLFTSQ